MHKEGSLSASRIQQTKQDMQHTSSYVIENIAHIMINKRNGELVSCSRDKIYTSLQRAAKDLNRMFLLIWLYRSY